MGVDRMGALRTAFASVRRAGTISIIGVYGGQADPFPMMDLFDKGVTIRMGQAHVKRWVDEIMPALIDDKEDLPRSGVQDRFLRHRQTLSQVDRHENLAKNPRPHPSLRASGPQDHAEGMGQAV